MKETSKSNIHISVVVPVYNNSASLEKNIHLIRTTVVSAGFPFELVLVDDCSGDDSWMVIKEICATYKEVKGVSLRSNQGQFEATRIGMGVATGKFIATIDADLEQQPEDILKMIEILDDNNIQVVFGIAKNKYVLKGERPVVANGRNKIINFILGKPVTDSFKVLRRSLLFNENQYLLKEQFEGYISKHLLMNQISYYSTLNQIREVGESSYTLWNKVKLFFAYSLDYYKHPFWIVVGIQLFVWGLSIIMGLAVNHQLEIDSVLLSSNTALFLMLFMWACSVLLLLAVSFVYHNFLKRINQKIPPIAERVNFDVL